MRFIAMLICIDLTKKTALTQVEHLPPGVILQIVPGKERWGQLSYFDPLVFCTYNILEGY
jgi:hypothetical protein